MRARGGWPVGLGLVGLVLLGAPLAYLARRPDAAAPSRPRLEQVTAGPGLDLYPSLSPDGREVAYASARGGSFELFVADGGGRERQLTSDGTHNVQPAWSPDGTTIAYHSRGRGGIWLMPAAGGPPRRLTAFGSRPAWSPDGTRVAFQSESQIDSSWTAVVPLAPSVVHVVAVAGGEPRAVTTAGHPAGGHGSPTWTPDGDRIAFVAYDRVRASLWLVGPDGGRLEQVALPGDQPLVSDPASCPGCDSIYYVSASEQGSSGIWKMRLRGGRGPEWVRSQVIGQGLERVRHLSLSRDGTRLTYSAVSAIAQLAWVAVDPVSGAPAGAPRVFVEAPGRSSRPVFSPDGRYVAFTHVEPGARSDVWVTEVQAGRTFRLTNDPGTDSFPSWLPDSRRVALLSDRGGHPALWEADVKTLQARPLLDLGEAIDAPRLSPDGHFVAFNWMHGGTTLNAWVAPLAGGPPRQLTRDDEQLAFPAWSPDGRALALQTKRRGSTQVAVLPLSPGNPPRRAGDPVLLTADNGLSWPHDWSPDGDKIAFASFRDDAGWNVAWVSRRTGEQRALTSYRSPSIYVRYPAWSPRGDQVVYEYTETRADVWTINLP